jgi:hypothetical protein
MLEIWMVHYELPNRRGVLFTTNVSLRVHILVSVAQDSCHLIS